MIGFSGTSIAAIVLPNYNTNPIGERAGLQGGAFLVRVNDVSATWYNPAGLVKAQRNSISGNASAFVSSEAKKMRQMKVRHLFQYPLFWVAWGNSIRTLLGDFLLQLQ